MDRDCVFMLEAIALAKEAYQDGEIPVGAVIVKNGKIVGRGRNTRERFHDVSGHAEIAAIKDAASFLGDWRLDGCSLYATLEPCLMCAGAIMQSRVASVFFGAPDPKEGALVSNYCVFDKPSSLNRPLVYPNVLSEECKSLLDEFFEEKRAPSN